MLDHSATVPVNILHFDNRIAWGSGVPRNKIFVNGGLGAQTLRSWAHFFNLVQCLSHGMVTVLTEKSLLDTGIHLVLFFFYVCNQIAMLWPKMVSVTNHDTYDISIIISHTNNSYKSVIYISILMYCAINCCNDDW